MDMEPVRLPGEPKNRCNLAGRLSNWKFDSAARYLVNSGITRDDAAIVRALARQYGNCGWFEGDAGTVIGFVVGELLKRMGVGEDLR